MKRDITVASIQSEVPHGHKYGEQQVERLVKQAVSQPVDLIGIPEYCLDAFAAVKAGYDPLPFLSSIARKYHVALFGATERRDSDGNLRNSGFYFDKDGKLVQLHNKIMLTPGEEKMGVVPGHTLEIFGTEFGKMSILVCKDAFHRHAAWFFNALSNAGADLVLVPSLSLNISSKSVGFWRDSLKLLSKWFGVYIVGPGTIGKNANPYPSFGHALIVCPSREILAEGSADREEILRATLETGHLNEVRGSNGSAQRGVKVPEFEVVGGEG